MPELIIDGFDAEQVWAGVDLQNKIKFPKIVAEVERLKRLVGNPVDIGGTNKQLKGNENVPATKSAECTFNLFTGGKYALQNSVNENDAETDEDDDLHEVDIDKSSRNLETREDSLFGDTKGKLTLLYFKN